MLAWIISRMRRFSKDCAGNAVMLVAVCAIPLVGMVGLALDYSLTIAVKTKLDHAVDAAAVAGITSAQWYITNYVGGGDPTSAAQAVGQTQALAQFNANAGKLPGGTLQITNMSVSRSNQTLTANAAYTFTMPTVFMKALGVQSVNISGHSNSSLTMAGYTNIYVVIDISSSMGIGATTSDQQIVYSVTGGCAVACHYTGTTTTARLAGATLRIDVAKQAVISAINLIENSGSPAQYQIAVYTMSDKLSNVFALSNNFEAAKTAVNNIDISNVGNDGGTDTTYMLKQLNSLLPTPGNGLTSATPQGTVMLITDGVQDSDMKYYSYGTWADSSDPNFTVFSPCNLSTCKYISAFGVYVEAFDPTQCTPLKTKGYTMMTLNVQYIVPASNLQSSDANLNAVFSYIQQYLLTSIPTNMSSCATSASNAYSANTPAEIQAAVSAMFTSAMAMARLTQ